MKVNYSVDFINPVSTVATFALVNLNEVDSVETSMEREKGEELEREADWTGKTWLEGDLT